MREWFTAKEFADMKLPDMPRTDRAIQIRAKNEGWKSRKRSGRGGGHEYHIDNLPPAALVAVRLAFNSPEPSPQESHALASAELWARFENLPDKDKEDARKKLAVLHAVEEIAGTMGRMEAYKAVAVQSGTTVPSIRRWFKQVKGVAPADWLPALAPKWAGGSNTADCDPAAWEYFKADYLRLDAPCAEACYERMERAAKVHNWTYPSLKTMLRRLHRELSPEAITLAREGEGALQRMYPAQERDRSIFHALEAVCADGHKFDVFVRWEDGSVGRVLMVAWQDLYSGKILAYRVARTENVEAVRLSFGDLVEEYGIPTEVWLDNGRAFASKWMTGRMTFRYRFKVKEEEPTGIFASLGIPSNCVHWATPYHGQAKPIERAFRDLCEYVAKHPSFSGAYTGNSPTAKPENYGSRAVPIDDFLKVLEAEVIHHNARQGRRSRVCNGRSFDETFYESYANAPIRKATEQQRRLWLMAAEGVNVNKTDGTVKIMGNNRYWSEKLSALRGKKIMVRFDPQDLQAGIHVYRLDGSYVGFADHLVVAGFKDSDAATKHNKARKDRRKYHKKMLDAERSMTAIEAAQLVPMPDEPETLAPNVVKPMFAQATGKQSADRDEDGFFDRVGEAVRQAEVAHFRAIGE